MGISRAGGRFGVPDLGVGVGLRIPHYRHILERRPRMGFFEIISENFMIPGGKPLYHLDRVLESYPVIQHGVSLSIGGPEPLDRAYLVRLKELTKRVRPAWVSDHFCWCGAGGAHLHDLLPLPYTEESVRLLAERAHMVQDYLELPFALENTSSYLQYTQSTMTEWQFVSEVVERADCGLMFDVNNVYVSAYNHGFDPLEFVRNVPHDRIVQIHLAGHTNLGRYIIDTHRGHVDSGVLELYCETIRLAGAISTLIEWDDEIPEFPVLAAEAEKVERLRELALGPDAAPLDRFVVPRPTEESAPSEASPSHGWQQGGPRSPAPYELVTSETFVTQEAE
jgi:uncharacterized protein (UPF0276 family)